MARQKHLVVTLSKKSVGSRRKALNNPRKYPVHELRNWLEKPVGKGNFLKIGDTYGDIAIALARMGQYDDALKACKHEISAYNKVAKKDVTIPVMRAQTRQEMILALKNKRQIPGNVITEARKDIEAQMAELTKDVVEDILMQHKKEHLVRAQKLIGFENMHREAISHLKSTGYYVNAEVAFLLDRKRGVLDRGPDKAHKEAGRAFKLHKKAFKKLGKLVPEESKKQ